MTHFNHEWDTTKTPAVPMSVGDRYYAQDLNDDFNYLKHLPYEAILQGRTKGVMIPPTDNWNANSHSLTLSGGFGVALLDSICLDSEESFTIPPKTKSSPRFERIPFADVALALPNDGNIHYIVATPTKRSLLQRTKALLTEQYASRIKYDGVITIQDTTPTTNQILVGLCHDDEYLLCKDFVLDQGIDTIKLHKWFGQNKITQSLVPALQSYYNTSIASVETKIAISTVNGDYGIGNGTFNNCVISIDTMSSSVGVGIGVSTFNNCTISFGTMSSSAYGIYSSTFNNCTISFGTISNVVAVIFSGTFNNCTISFGTMSNGAYGIFSGTFNNCTISFGTMSNGAYGIYSGTFNNCVISIDTTPADHGIFNTNNVTLYFTHIKCSAITNLSNTGGKLNVLNNAVLHAS